MMDEAEIDATTLVSFRLAVRDVPGSKKRKKSLYHIFMSIHLFIFHYSGIWTIGSANSQPSDPRLCCSIGSISFPFLSPFLFFFFLKLVMTK